MPRALLSPSVTLVSVAGGKGFWGERQEPLVPPALGSLGMEEKDLGEGVFCGVRRGCFCADRPPPLEPVSQAAGDVLMKLELSSLALENHKLPSQNQINNS